MKKPPYCPTGFRIFISPLMFYGKESVLIYPNRAFEGFLEFEWIYPSGEGIIVLFSPS